MDAIGTIFALVIGIGFWYLIFIFIKKVSDKKKFIQDDNSFTQSGVTINYPNQTIQIEKYLYKVSQVTGIKSTIRKTQIGEQVIVNIEVDDLEKPVHSVGFLGKIHADTFTQRLSVALRKAGGPSFV